MIVQMSEVSVHGSASRRSRSSSIDSQAYSATATATPWTPPGAPIGLVAAPGPVPQLAHDLLDRLLRRPLRGLVNHPI